MRHPIRNLSRSLLAALLAVSAVLTSLALGSAPAGALAPVSVARHDSADRYVVARLSAEAAFPGGTGHALLARGDLFPDALAASYLAGDLNAPILLTEGGSLHPEAALALDHLNVTTVHLLGGTGAISDSVATALTGLGYTVDRIAGTNRYETAGLVAALPGAANVGSVAGKKTAIVASGVNFPDALAAGPMSFSKQLPLLLTDPNALTPVTDGVLDTLGIQHVLLLGGTVAVSDAVSNELVLSGRTVQRLAGPDRFATGAAIADYARDTLGWAIDELILATGVDFPDAEVAGPLGGLRHAPIVLVNDGLPAPSLGVCTSNANTVDKLMVQGAVSSVNNPTVDQCKAAVAAVNHKAGWVWADQSGAASYTPSTTYQFNSAGATNTITRSGVGVYSVKFAGLGVGGGTVHVSAYGTDGYCKSGGWSPAGGDLFATVHCFDAAHAPADKRFTATFEKPVAPAGPLAYVWANDDNNASYTPATSYQYNSTGASNTITRNGAGDYVVKLPGLAGANGTVMVTAYGSSADRCKVQSWGASGADENVNVNCFDSAGNPVDERFTMTYVRNGGLSPAVTRWAYVWANNSAAASYTPSASYQANSAGGSSTIDRLGVGSYRVIVPGQANVQGTHVQVTAYGSSSNRCSIQSWGSSGSDMRVNVTCHDNGGADVDTQFTMALQAA